MEPEVSLPCLQKPATWPYPEQINPVHILPSYFFLKIQFISNLVLSSHPLLLISKDFYPPGFPAKVLSPRLITEFHL